MKEYKNYIFDLDGTLLSSLEDLAASTNYALRKYGMNDLIDNSKDGQHQNADKKV